MGYGTIFLTFMTVGVVGAGAIYEVVRAQANTTRRELSHPEAPNTCLLYTSPSPRDS